MNNITKYIQNALNIAHQKGLIPSSEYLVIPQVMRNADYITECIIRHVWDFHEKRNIRISGGEENRMIFRYCAWAGIYRTNSYFKTGELCDEDITLAEIEKEGIDKISIHICNMLNIHLFDLVNHNDIYTYISEQVYNELYYDNLNFCGGVKAKAQWETIKETALILFYVGMIYERHRSANKYPKRPMNWWE